MKNEEKHLQKYKKLTEIFSQFVFLATFLNFYEA